MSNTEQLAEALRGMLEAFGHAGHDPGKRAAIKLAKEAIGIYEMEQKDQKVSVSTKIHFLSEK